MHAIVPLLHAGAPLLPHDLWTAWSLDPLVVIPLAIAGIMYWRGVRALWASAGRGRGIAAAQVRWFAAGWLVLLVALVSPLHALGEVLFSAHMTQHELLMVLAAPLLVLGEPGIAFAWSLPQRWRRPAMATPVARFVAGSWHWMTGLATALVVHVAVLIAWHIPALYQATLRSDLVHALQHTSFVVSALAFWWGLLRARGARRGIAVGYLFVAMVVTGLLGALLTFANALWYPAYASTSGPWGITAIDDQRLGGMIMWIPGGLAYLVAALWLFGDWLSSGSTPTGDVHGNA